MKVKRVHSHLHFYATVFFRQPLTAFYRTTLELQQIGQALLTYQLPFADSDSRATIVNKLMFDFHSHEYALTGSELAEIGLNVTREPQIEKWAWQISKQIQARLGGGIRASLDDPWIDAVVATSERSLLRQTNSQGLAPLWMTGEHHEL